MKRRSFRPQWPSERWLPLVATLLLVWACTLGLWWQRLGPVRQTAQVSPGTTPRPTQVATARPTTVAATIVATPPVVAVERTPEPLVREHDWVALARSFDASRARQDIAELAGPRFAGRAVGSPGGLQAAEWIAGQFALLGLQPLGDNGTFFQEFPVPYAELTAMPRLEVLGTAPGQAPFRFRQDYTLAFAGYSDGGSAVAGVLWV